MRAIVPIIHYAESIFATRDFDRTGVLESKELWAAYPVIQPFIKKIGGEAASSEILQRAIFSYLVVFGEPPTADWIGGGQLLAWSVARYMVNEQADRLDVMKVMAGFGIAGRRDRRQKVTDFYKAEIASRPDEYRRRLSSGDPQTVRKLAEQFQCLGEPLVQSAFRQRVKERGDGLVPAKKDADEFIHRVRAMINSDRRLEFGCLSF
jgi:hypothetical protein